MNQSKNDEFALLAKNNINSVGNSSSHNEEKVERKQHGYNSV